MRFTYKDYHRNHLILPGREQALDDFLNQELEGVRHKQNHKCNPNSEDALTWSCFEMLKSLPFAKKLMVLDEMFEDAFSGEHKPIFQNTALQEDDLKIYIGKEYTSHTTGESTELDASIELPGALVFVEAKLYSPMSAATDTKRDQIARKLRVGLDTLDAHGNNRREFFFIFLDIAPLDKINAMKKPDKNGKCSSSGFNGKWTSAKTFSDYKNTPAGKPNSALREALTGIPNLPPLNRVTANMGWLTWASLFKSILRGIA